jgi:hypothetical protein
MCICHRVHESMSPIIPRNSLDDTNKMPDTFKETLFNLLLSKSNDYYTNLDNWYLEKNVSINIKDTIKKSIYESVSKNGKHPETANANFIIVPEEHSPNTQYLNSISTGEPIPCNKEDLSNANLTILKLNIKKYLHELGYSDSDILEIELNNTSSKLPIYITVCLKINFKKDIF